MDIRHDRTKSEGQIEITKECYFENPETGKVIFLKGRADERGESLYTGDRYWNRGV